MATVTGGTAKVLRMAWIGFFVACALVVVACVGLIGYRWWTTGEWFDRPVGPDGLRKVRISEVVLPQASIVGGASIAQWGERWWIWLLRSPNVYDPAKDMTGENCQFGQSGPVWFLAGSYGARPVSRRCTVPEGKHILFPVANTFTRPRPLKLSTCDEEVATVAKNVEVIDELFTIINGREVPEVKTRHRERTGGCFDSGTGRELTASDGYWIMLKPLPVGEYRIEFGMRDSKGKGNKTKHVVVNLTVAPAGTALTDYPPWPPRDDPSLVAQGELRIDMPVMPVFDGGHVIRRALGLMGKAGKYILVDEVDPPTGSAIALQMVPRDLALIERATPEIVGYMRRPLSIWVTPPDRDVVRFVVPLLPETEGPALEWRKATNADMKKMLLDAMDKKVIVSDDEMGAGVDTRQYPWRDVTAHRAALPSPAPPGVVGGPK